MKKLKLYQIKIKIISLFHKKLKQNLNKNYDCFFLLKDSIQEEEEKEESNLYEKLNSKEYSQSKIPTTF